MSARFRWVDLLDKPRGDDNDASPYLGTSLEDGVLCHRWFDGTSLPVLAGGAGDDDGDDDDDGGEDDDDDGSDVDDESNKDGKKKASQPSTNRAHRQAARFRIEAKTERERADTAEGRADAAEERADALLVELAFTRAAGDRFADSDAAWKLINRKLIKIDDDGEVSGVDEAIDALIESHPFIERADDDETPSKKNDDNPFRSLTSGSPMRGKRRPTSDQPSAAKLAAKYPALRNR